MSTASKMLESRPHPLGEIDRVKLTASIDACAECNQACTACADKPRLVRHPATQVLELITNAASSI